MNKTFFNCILKCILCVIFPVFFNQTSTMNLLWIPWLKVFFYFFIFVKFLACKTKQRWHHSITIWCHNGIHVHWLLIRCCAKLHKIISYIISHQKKTTNKQNKTIYEIVLKLEYFLAIQKSHKNILLIINCLNFILTLSYQ